MPSRRIVRHVGEAALSDTGGIPMPRDPRIDPEPGDILLKGGREVMIHFVKDATVYFGATEGTIGGFRMSLEQFREQAIGAEVRPVEGK